MRKVFFMITIRALSLFTFEFFEVFVRVVGWTHAAPPGWLIKRKERIKKIIE